MLVADGTVLDTRGAFNDMGASSKDVVARDVVTRDALELLAPFFFTSDDVTVCYPLGKPSINIGNPFG